MDNTRVELSGPDGVIFEGTSDEFSALADKVSKDAALGGAAGQLKSIIQRIERLNSEIADLQEDVRDIYAEAKGNGFHVAAIRQVIAERKKDAEKRAEQLSMFDLYWKAVH